MLSVETIVPNLEHNVKTICTHDQTNAEQYSYNLHEKLLGGGFVELDEFAGL